MSEVLKSILNVRVKIEARIKMLILTNQQLGNEHALVRDENFAQIKGLQVALSLMTSEGV